MLVFSPAWAAFAPLGPGDVLAHAVAEQPEVRPVLPVQGPQGDAICEEQTELIVLKQYKTDMFLMP